MENEKVTKVFVEYLMVSIVTNFFLMTVFG